MLKAVRVLYAIPPRALAVEDQSKSSTKLPDWLLSRRQRRYPRKHLQLATAQPLHHPRRTRIGTRTSCMGTAWTSSDCGLALGSVSAPTEDFSPPDNVPTPTSRHEHSTT